MILTWVSGLNLCERSSEMVDTRATGSTNLCIVHPSEPWVQIPQSMRAWRLALNGALRGRNTSQGTGRHV